MTKNRAEREVAGHTATGKHDSIDEVLAGLGKAIEREPVSVQLTNLAIQLQRCLAQRGKL